MQMASLRHSVVTNIKLYQIYFQELAEIEQMKQNMSAIEEEIFKISNELQKMSNLSIPYEQLDISLAL